MANVVFQMFPQSRRFYFNPPPPMLDWSSIEKLPEPLEEMLYLGHPPPQLRLKLYEMQTRILRDHAKSQNAEFIDVPHEALDPAGFLARQYVDNDPTHANARYGEKLLKHILDHTRATP